MVALQVIAGFARLGKFIRLVPQPVMLGFINGLALVIGVAQLETFHDPTGGWLHGPALIATGALTALTMAVLWAWEQLDNPVPAPLVAVVVTSAVAILAKLPVVTLGNVAKISGHLPQPHVPQVPPTLESAMIILPVAASVAAVGLIEALLAQQLLDELSDSRTQTHVECVGQGLANVRSCHCSHVRFQTCNH